MFVDTHTHLYARQFDEDRREVIVRAIQSGVEKFYLPNIDRGSIEGMLALEQEFPGRCFPMMGLHPCSVKENVEEELQAVRNYLDLRPFVAVGEIGIDLYWDKTFVEQQKYAFLKQTEWAMEAGLPIIIHSRESIDLIVELLQPYKGPDLRGIFHCFTGTLEQARSIMALDFLMGIGGVLTFKKANLGEVLQEVPLEYLVLETDAPYLAPTPHRGQRNESGYIPLIAQRLAEVKGVTAGEIGRMTTKNAEKLFHQTTKVPGLASL